MTLTQASEGGLKISNAGSNGQFLQKSSNTGGLTWADVSSVGGATGVDFNDDVYIRLGTGNDLKLWHNAGANSYIRNESGNLLIESNGAGADAIQVVAGAAVELFHGGTKHFETTTNGIKVENSTATAITVVSANNADGGIYFNDGENKGAVLYQHDGNYMDFRVDGTEKVRIESSGSMLFLDGAKVHFGGANNVGGDLQIWHDGSGNNSYIANGTGNLILSNSDVDAKSISLYGDAGLTENLAHFIQGGSVELYHHNVKTLQTEANGITVSGPDAGDAYIQLYADRGDDDADKYKISTSATGGFWVENKVSGSWETNLYAVGNGAVELYHNNDKTFETRSDGIKITGENNSYAVIEFNADNGDDNADKWLQYASTDGIINWQSYTSGSWVTKFEVRSGGDIKVNNGNILMGTSGTGINFSATADGSGASNVAEVFDDYEEGTFTPTLQHDTDSSNSVDGVGAYTKVGNKVTCNIAFINKTASSLPTGAIAAITGLPYTANHPTGQADGFSTCSKPIEMSLTQRNGGLWHTVNGTSKLNAHYMNQNSTWSVWYSDDFQKNSLYLIFNITYWTTS